MNEVTEAPTHSLKIYRFFFFFAHPLNIFFLILTNSGFNMLIALLKVFKNSLLKRIRTIKLLFL